MDNTLFLIIMAIIPPALLILLTYFLDKKEKEPLSLLVALFAMGIVSIFPALIAELVGEGVLGLIFSENTYIYQFISAFFIVAAAEEGFKYLLMKLVSWKNKAFDYRFDGVVYAVCTSLGFATLENILYVLQNGFANAIVRGLTAIPLHASCGVIMGIYYGFAKGCAYAGNESGRKKNARLAYLIPLVVHGVYDFCLFVNMVGIWFVFTVAAFIVVGIKLVSSSKKDAPITVAAGAVYGQEGSWFPTENSTGRFAKWTCVCGAENTTNFCPVCGRAKSGESTTDAMNKM